MDTVKIKKSKIKKEKLGLTLIEILVAILVFGIILGPALNFFILHIKTQKILLAQQFLLDQTNYTIEYISRALRMAKKELNCTDPQDFKTCKIFNPQNSPYCLDEPGYGYNYQITREGQGIKFINPMKNYACQEFFVENGILKEKIIKPQSESRELPLFSEKIKINKLRFEIFGDGQEDSFQPKVTLIMELEIPSQKIKLNIQNTISQRDIDIKQ